MTVPGAEFDDVRVHRLDRIDDDERRAPAFFQRRDDVLDIRCRDELDRRLRKAQTHGTQTHLRDRLFAGDVDDALTAKRHGGAGLQQQRRFADTRLAAEQQHGARHEAATGDAIEFGDAGLDARIGPAFADKALNIENPARDGTLCGARADAGGGRFLDDRVPLAAGFAAALPAIRHCAAVLADEGCARTGHARV